MTYRITAAVAVTLVLVTALAWMGYAWRTQQRWFELNRQQRATIQRLEQFPPSGTDAGQWEQVIGTLHNVWGNVTYDPSHCGLNKDDMSELQRRLEGILQQTTSDNSIESCDRIYRILLEFAKNPRFVSGFHDEFREVYLNKGPGVD